MQTVDVKPWNADQREHYQDLMNEIAGELEDLRDEGEDDGN